MRKRKAGFTLIELLVVIAIIALLLSILMPALSRAKELAKRVVCGNNLKQISVAVTGYEGKFSGLLPNTHDLAVAANSSGSGGVGEQITGNLPNMANRYGSQENHPYVCYRGDREDNYVNGDMSANGKMIAYRFACLYEAHLLDNPETFYCPSNKDKNRQYGSYIEPGPWGTLPQRYNTESNSNQWVRAGYEWFPVERHAVCDGHPFAGRPRAPTKYCTKFEKLDQLLPYCTDTMRTRESFSHQYGKVLGLNALWPDGHVLFFDDQNVFRNSLWNADPGGKPGEEIMAIYYQRIVTIGTGSPYWP